VIKVHDTLQDIWWEFPKTLIGILVPYESPAQLGMHQDPWCAVGNIGTVLWSIVGLPPSVLVVARSSAMAASMSASLLILLALVEGLLDA
jgi:hypothetical protein